MVGQIVTDFPQAVWRQRRQECDSTDPLVQRFIRRVRAVTGIVTDDEQAGDPQRCDQGGKNLDPPCFDDQQARNGDTEHQPVRERTR